MIVDMSSSDRAFKIVVLPALSRPKIRSLTSSLDHNFENILEKINPMKLYVKINYYLILIMVYLIKRKIM